MQPVWRRLSCGRLLARLPPGAGGVAAAAARSATARGASLRGGGHGAVCAAALAARLLAGGPRLPLLLQLRRGPQHRVPTPLAG
eukprot:6535190-Prymnesium_polylepis.1